MAYKHYPARTLVDNRLTFTNDFSIHRDDTSGQFYAVYTVLAEQLFPAVTGWSWQWHGDLKFYEHEIRLTLKELSDLTHDKDINKKPSLKSRFVKDYAALTSAIIRGKPSDIQVEFNQTDRSNAARHKIVDYTFDREKITKSIRGKGKRPKLG